MAPQKKRDLTMDDILCVYRIDWNDSYDTEVDPEVKDLERKVKCISSKPNTYTEYMEAEEIYCAWMDYLFEKHVGCFPEEYQAELFWKKVEKGLIDDYIPQKPRPTNKKLKRQVEKGLNADEWSELNGCAGIEISPEEQQRRNEEAFQARLAYEGITEEEYNAEFERVRKLYDPDYDESYAWSTYAPLYRILNADLEELDKIEAEEKEKKARAKAAKKAAKEAKKKDKRVAKCELRRIESTWSHLSKKERKKKMKKLKAKAKQSKVSSEVDFFAEAFNITGGRLSTRKPEYLKDEEDRKSKKKKLSKKEKKKAKKKKNRRKLDFSLSDLMKPDWRKRCDCNVEDYDYFAEQDEAFDNQNVFLQTDEHSKTLYRKLEKLGWNIYALAVSTGAMSKKEAKKAKKKKKQQEKNKVKYSIDYLLRPEDQDKVLDLDYDDAFNQFLAETGQSDMFADIYGNTEVINVECPKKYADKFA